MTTENWISVIVIVLAVIGHGIRMGQRLTKIETKLELLEASSLWKKVNELASEVAVIKASISDK
jgi:hypothetical protein